MKNLTSRLIVIAIVTGIGHLAYAQAVSNLSVYHRCYAQITQKYAKRSSERAIQVLSGAKDPITACLEVLDKAKFVTNAGTQMADVTDSEAIDALRTMHVMHYSWFQNRFFSELDQAERGNKSIMDSSGPALYYTRALFAPNVKFSSILTDAQNLRAIRSMLDKDGTGAYVRRSPYGAQAISSFQFRNQANFTFAPQGDLWGVRYMPTNLKWVGATRNGTPVTADLALHFGGGILGSQEYLVLNSGQPIGFFKTDGVVNVPRRWANMMVQDVLCRELPLVRVVDASVDSVTGEKLVNSAASAPFRQGASCAQCHVTMDRAAFTIRNWNLLGTGGEQTENIGGAFPTKYPVTHIAENSWPLVPDGQFHLRPTRGTLYFRTHDGTLVNQAVTGPADLGAKLAAQDAPYICAAKRYYEYFTGIRVSVGDIGDPAHSVLSSSELVHRNIVIDLGKALKNDPYQSSRTLIENILRSPIYRKSVEGVRSIADVK